MATGKVAKRDIDALFDPSIADTAVEQQRHESVNLAISNYADHFASFYKGAGWTRLMRMSAIASPPRPAIMWSGRRSTSTAASW
ncbi:hypothetical protein DM806_21405 [Sphingobium lactosutens]|uniref:hypothetical protein n=1 Tax=Sphingobium lactosutens TaxID=522773 RepID=UPI0015C0391D|nr:hypothetical protein [Sphingobium lactosutens]NWK98172.1 hypothetical protein [Sphingobium lactosutens]